jgi:hypothetical protein
MSEPGAGWEATDFDDSSWKQGAAPFQSGDHPLFRTGTKWAEGGIWLRREFELDGTPQNLWMEILENIEEGAVYLNGKRVLEVENPRPGHRHYSNRDLTPHVGLLRLGKNVIAVHGKQEEGRRALDGGLYTVR